MVTVVVLQGVLQRTRENHPATVEHKAAATKTPQQLVGMGGKQQHARRTEKRVMRSCAFS